MLDDQGTVIGVNARNLRYLQIENFMGDRQLLQKINVKNHIITLVSVNRERRELLLGDDKGQVAVYNYDSETASWKSRMTGFDSSQSKKSRFQKLDCGPIRACARLGHLVVLGGDGPLVFDTLSNRVVQKFKSTASSRIYSMEFCTVSDRVLLVVSGNQPGHFGSQNDSFDVTDIFGDLGLPTQSLLGTSVPGESQGDGMKMHSHTQQEESSKQAVDYKVASNSAGSVVDCQLVSDLRADAAHKQKQIDELMKEAATLRSENSKLEKSVRALKALVKQKKNKHKLMMLRLSAVDLIKPQTFEQFSEDGNDQTRENGRPETMQLGATQPRQMRQAQKSDFGDSNSDSMQNFLQSIRQEHTLFLTELDRRFEQTRPSQEGERDTLPTISCLPSFGENLLKNSFQDLTIAKTLADKREPVICKWSWWCEGLIR